MPSSYKLEHPPSESNFVNPAYNQNGDTEGETTNGKRHSPPPDYEEVGPAAKGELPANGAVDMTEDDDDSKKDKDKKKKKEKPPVVSIGQTFKYATGTDKLCMVVGTICAMLHGAALPCLIIIFGQMSDSFISYGSILNIIEANIGEWESQCAILYTAANCANVTVEFLQENPLAIGPMCVWLQGPTGCLEIAEVLNETFSNGEYKDLTDQMEEYAIYYVIIGCCVLVVGYLQVLGWQTAAVNQTQRIRTLLFWSILKQEVGWFDTHEIGELNTRLTDDVGKIEAGIGDKLGLFFQWTSAFLAGIIIGFVYSWKLTLVILAVSPLMALSGMVMGKLGASMTAKELSAYAKAGAVAEEVFGAIRTVVAFGGETKECDRYDNNLYEARDFGIRKGMINGISMGMIFFVMFGSYGLAFWYGSKLLMIDNEPDFTAGTLMIVFFCVLIGTFSLGNAAPNIQEFASARGAAYTVYQIIENKPDIDSSSKEGLKGQDIKGNVEFTNVHFNYPSRPDVKVLKGVSMKINVGQTVALVGPSGCGKSTTVQLIQRFYDPHEGQVTLDGMDISTMNVKWLRQQIGVVSQEPVLFATTIMENIRYGQDGISNEDIVRAAKEANAHDFVSQLPNQYETLVGERGAQLSGGQKQRIAIARALVRNPKVLLLDEATSALDTESEATVQAALDQARMGRTTLVIAHRLSTIRTADVIIGVKDGCVEEQGTHDELMGKKGLYYNLVTNQQMDDEDIDLGEEKPPLIRGVSTRISGSKLNHGVSVTSQDTIPAKSSAVTAEEEEEEKLPDPKMSRLMKLNGPELGLIVGGCIASIIVGAVQPAFAIIFSEMLGVYAIYDQDEAWDKVKLYSGMFAVIGTVAGVGMICMGVTFSRAGEYLTMRLRKQSFNALIRQDMAYFDDHKNNVGALCTRLGTDTSAVQGATGSRLATVLQSISAIGAGIIIGFVYSWQLTLLIIGFAPLLLVSGFIQMKIMSGSNKGRLEALEQAGKIAVEAIENIRTVATLTKEEKFHNDFVLAINKPFRDAKKKAHLQGLGYGFSQGIIFGAYAASFTLGSYLVEREELEFQNMFKVFAAIVFGAMSIGQASSFAPDVGKAKASAAKIFALLDREPPIDSYSEEGQKLAAYQGSVELRDVHFNYPTRPDMVVLQGLDFQVRPGQTVALVGSSGCGKSTTVQLLERFYDTHQGSMCLDGCEVKKLNLAWLRSQMGIVSQEPVLFARSIKDNIAYGDNSRNVSMDEIIAAARDANIHNFIDSLPQGYETDVGEKGAQLSGGQKQRVAIARALVRNPKLLLLDEATSALDTESEQIVQAALDKAQEGRTCIVIAHRLSTIQNADNIIVIHLGKIVESGTHSELIQQKGRYFKLNNAQLKKK